MVAGSRAFGEQDYPQVNRTFMVNLAGGLLFSLGFSETGDYRNLPSYDELGRSADGNYFLIYPTDYQAYDKVKSARAEYDAMWAEIGYVHDNSFCFLPDAA